mmetsp:Transcript_12929/g.12821  ORF Transcript_12929/g.12821 Transcript_12929/m.12821 type:complete len:172 (+) Transcript_12929:78-593(+)
MLIASGLPDCESANLRFATFLLFLIYAGIFILMLIQFLGCVDCLKSIPNALMVFYFLIVGSMFYIQVVLFSDNDCRTTSIVMYFWLVANIVFFYFIVAYGVAKWGSYICWDAQMKEEHMKAAIEKYLKETANPSQEPLLIQQYDTSSEDNDDEEEQPKKKSKGQKALAIKA